MSDFNAVARRFIAAKQQMRELELELQGAQEELLTFLDEDKTHVKFGATTFVLTKVVGFRKSYLAETIKTKLSPANWKKVQKVEVDRAKLEACIKAGDFELPDECVETTPIRPYVKMTEWSSPLRLRKNAAA